MPRMANLVAEYANNRSVAAMRPCFSKAIVEGGFDWGRGIVFTLLAGHGRCAWDGGVQCEPC